MYSELNFKTQLGKLMPVLGIRTQAELAKITGVSRQIISKWFNMEQPPAAKYFSQLANLLGFKIEYLFLNDPPEKYLIDDVNVIKKRFDTLELVNPAFSVVIVYSRDLKTQREYRSYCKKHKIRYHEATSIHKLESDLKVCRPDCIYTDSDLPVEVIGDIRVCRISDK